MQTSVLDDARGRREILLHAIALAAGSMVAPKLAVADSYPSRPIKLVVPYASGGAPDLMCRLLASELGPVLGQPIVVDNKPGASGAIGLQALSLSPPDGYTIGYGNVSTLAINPHLYGRLP